MTPTPPHIAIIGAAGWSRAAAKSLIGWMDRYAHYQERPG
jgi:hypothetical protein